MGNMGNLFHYKFAQKTEFGIMHAVIATLAQLVEQLTRNEQVVGSNPTGGFFSLCAGG